MPRGLTQEELAKHINSTKQTIYKYENNIITNIPSDKIEKIAEVLQTTPAYLMGWDEIEKDYKHSTELSDIYYNGLKNWTEDKMLKKHETAILRQHIANLLLRYKILIEKFVYAQIEWRKSKDDFMKLYKQRKEPLSDIEIKELFLKQELEKQIEDMVLWLRNFPGWFIMPPLVKTIF
ncbi:helix-turn-helix domain-containing protein [Thermoclostridium caenicola]|uniref:helix-turn-helix domain-containing protein n=1 Tax=Thermoclostridium caenicola TaxID=659425 RepID=UPI001FAA056C|nr:helix-turn-helix transcriptional regulator [Thermoclostridium caenicola]